MPVLIKFTNNFGAPLAAGISSSATSIPLATGYGALLPNYTGGEYEYMTLVDSANHMEIVKVTARAGDTLTVVRAQDGTTARAWIAGDRINSRPCAAAMYDALQVNQSKANSGANSDITSLTGLTTPLAVSRGGTGAATLTLNAALLGNGTSAPLAVSPGTSGNLLTSNGTTWQSTAPATQASLGVGQTWQDMTGSRTVTTVYQNTTGKPIMVSIICQGDGGQNQLFVGSVSPPTLCVDYEISAGTAGASRHALQAVVPNNHYYKMTSASAAFIISWLELR